MKIKKKGGLKKMKPRILTIGLEVRTDIPVQKLKSGLLVKLQSNENYVFEVLEKPKINVIKDTKVK